MGGPRWSEDEVDYLMRHYAYEDSGVILDNLPSRDWRSVQCKARNLCLERFIVTGNCDYISIVPIRFKKSL